MILRQVLKKYRTRDPKLIPYQRLVNKMTKKFHRLIFVHVPRLQNVLADSLASLSLTLCFPSNKDKKTIIVQRLHHSAIHNPWFKKALEKVKT